MGSATRFFPEVVAQASGLVTASADAIDLSEIMHESAEVTSLAVEIQQLEAMAAGINNLHSVGESVQGDEGFSEQTFAVIASQASLITEGTGLDPVRANMQSFSSGDNLAQTNVVMLALTDTAKNIWNAIIKAIKDLFAKIQQWFAKITNAVPATIKRFEKLRDEARAKTSGMKDDDKITLSSSVVKALGNGKSPKVDRGTVMALPKMLIDTAKGVKKSTDVDKSTQDNIISVLNAVNVDSNKSVLTTLESLVGALGSAADEATDASDSNEKADASLNKKLGLPEWSTIIPLGAGNKGIVTKIPEDPKYMTQVDNLAKGLQRNDSISKSVMNDFVRVLDKAVRVAKTTVTVGNVVPDVESADSQEIKAYPASDIVDMCNDAIETLEHLKTFKEDNQKSSKAITKFTDAVMKAADKVENAKVDDDLRVAQAANVKVIKSTADIAKGHAMLPPQMAEFILTVTGALYTVGKQSLSAHK